MRLANIWTPHNVIVEPFLGEGANGDTWGDPVTVGNVFVEDVQEIAVDDSGKEILSLGRVIFNFDDAPLKRSFVTVWLGSKHERRSEVFKLSLNDHPAWPGFAIGYLR